MQDRWLQLCSSTGLASSLRRRTTTRLAFVQIDELILYDNDPNRRRWTPLRCVYTARLHERRTYGLVYLDLILTEARSLARAATAAEL